MFGRPSKEEIERTKFYFETIFPDFTSKRIIFIVVYISFLLAYIEIIRYFVSAI